MESNKKLQNKILAYSLLSKCFKWVGIGLGVAGVIAGITVGILSGFTTGLVTLFGCFVFGASSYLASTGCEKQSLALSAELQPHQEPMVETFDKNRLNLNVKEKTYTNSQQYYTTNIHPTPIQNQQQHIENQKIKTNDGTEYYTLSNGDKESDYTVDSLEK